MANLSDKQASKRAKKKGPKGEGGGGQLLKANPLEMFDRLNNPMYPPSVHNTYLFVFLFGGGGWSPAHPPPPSWV